MAHLIWDRFGDVPNYVEPFFGSGAVLLQRPHDPRTETVNDINGFICNFWRSIKLDPEATAEHASWPVNENHLHSVHQWLLRTAREIDLTTRLDQDPEFFDAQIAGRWCWGACSWIGSGWCDTEKYHRWTTQEALCDAGRGINRQLPHIGNAGQGVNRKLPHIGNAGQGVKITAYFEALSSRMDRTRVCCGEWDRVLGPSVTFRHGTTAIFLDPPYAVEANRADGLYANDDLQVAHKVREWATENGDNPELRICLAGYEGEHTMPDDWECVAWKARGGYSSQRKDGENANPEKERLWFSAHCLRAEDDCPLFASIADGAPT